MESEQGTPIHVRFDTLEIVHQSRELHPDGRPAFVELIRIGPPPPFESITKVEY